MFHLSPSRVGSNVVAHNLETWYSKAMFSLYLGSLSGSVLSLLQLSQSSIEAPIEEATLIASLLDYANGLYRFMNAKPLALNTFLCNTAARDSRHSGFTLLHRVTEVAPAASAHDSLGRRRGTGTGALIYWGRVHCPNLPLGHDTLLSLVRTPFVLLYMRSFSAWAQPLQLDRALSLCFFFFCAGIKALGYPTLSQQLRRR